MRTTLLALLFGLLAGLPWVYAEDPPKEEPPKEEPAAEEGTETGLVWLSDYDEARQKAAEAKKGLFVYLTPNWFT